MEIEPNENDVTKCIVEVASRQLDSMPRGSTVMISECIGIKSMPFMWTVRVHGLWTAVKVEIRRLREWLRGKGDQNG